MRKDPTCALSIRKLQVFADLNSQSKVTPQHQTVDEYKETQLLKSWSSVLRTVSFSFYYFIVYQTMFDEGIEYETFILLFYSKKNTFFLLLFFFYVLIILTCIYNTFISTCINISLCFIFLNFGSPLEFIYMYCIVYVCGWEGKSLRNILYHHLVSSKSSNCSSKTKSKRILRIGEWYGYAMVANGIQHAQHLTHLHERVRLVVCEEAFAEWCRLKLKRKILLQ